jgi:hypothetical protein
VQRLTGGKMHLRFTRGDPAAPLNHDENHITSATKWAVRATGRDGEFRNWRNVVREDRATENAL